MLIVMYNGIEAMTIKLASRCFNNTYKVHRGTQSSHNGVRGTQEGTGWGCIKRSHVVRFSQLYCM